MNFHGGTGSPDYGDLHGTGGLVQLSEATFFSQRPLVHLLLGGVFERFPRLKVVMTELGCHWVPQWLRQLDGIGLEAAGRDDGGAALRGRAR